MRNNRLDILVTTGAALTVALCGCGGGNKTAGSGDPKPAVKVNPAAVQALAKAPSPPPNARKVTGIGSGPAALSTSDAPGDADSSWVEQIDIDGDGDVEATTLVWDDEDKVLYASAQTEVPCDEGGVATAALLIGVNAKGNSREMKAGSGFYVVYLDATECFAQVAGLYGCRFDARGEVVAAGEVVMDEASDDITIVTYSRY